MTEQINQSPPSLIQRIRENLIYLAWAQALIATFISLFLSEVMGFPPCILCWYQRILMYPLVLIIGVGILLRDTRIRYYVLPMTLLAIGIGFYHNLLYYGAIPEEFHICTSGVPCETRWIEWFGFAGIPLGAFTAFTVITLALLWYKPAADEQDIPVDETVPTRTGAFVKWGSVVLVVAYALILFTALTSRLIENSSQSDESDQTTALETAYSPAASSNRLSIIA